MRKWAAIGYIIIALIMGAAVVVDIVEKIIDWWRWRRW